MLWLVSLMLYCGLCKINEPTHDKPTIRCETTKDSDQPVCPSSMAKVLVYPSLDSVEAVEGTYNQRRLIRLRGCACACVREFKGSGWCVGEGYSEV